MGEGKQRNKVHKGGKHASKRERDKKAGNGDNKRGNGTSVGRKKDGGTSRGRAERAHAARLQREERRRAVLKEKREESNGAPRVIAIVPLSAAAADEWIQVHNLLMGEILMGKAKDITGNGDEKEKEVVTTVNSERFKGRLSFLNNSDEIFYPKSGNENTVAMLRVIAASDIIVLLCVAEEGREMIDDKGLQIIKLMNSYGHPSIVGALLGVSVLPTKLKNSTKHNALEALQHFFPNIKMYPLETPAEAQTTIRHVLECRIGHNRPAWRQRRPQMLLEKVDHSENLADSGQENESVSLFGWIRVQPMSVNQLVHITGIGDFSIAKIEVMEKNRKFVKADKGSLTEMMDVDNQDSKVICELLPQEDLQDVPIRENEEVWEEEEQTWPTEEELAEAELCRLRDRRRRRKLPKGMSAYQAAWILDDMLDDEEEDLDNSEDDLSPNGEMDIDEDFKFVDTEGAESMWGDYDDNEEDPVEAKLKLKAERREANVEDLEFPDEVDTPSDIRARERFHKYRGLKSFRSTTWDATEGHPQEYSKIFDFENFKATARRSQMASAQGLSAAEFVKKVESNAALPGCYCKITIKNVPLAKIQELKTQMLKSSVSGPPILVGLMMHESKMSVLNFSAVRTGPNSDVIRSKDEMTIVAGFRVFKSRPIYSTDDIRADKHKLEKFLHPGRNVIASLYMPICYGPMPFLMFNDKSVNQLELVATGSFRSVDPGRIILKKIVLSGYINKVHKNKAVVKYMYHYPEDVLFFRPLELWTKYGRRGRIKEAVGTHGAMKCIFDGVVQQRDTCCVSLYKRQFPPWPSSGSFGYPLK